MGEAQGAGIGGVNRTDSGAAVSKSVGKLLDSAAQRGDLSDSADGNAVHPVGSDGRGIRRAAGNQPFHALNHLAHIADLFGRLIWYGDVKFVFQSEENVHAVHGVDAQLFKRAVDSDLLDGDALRVGDNGSDTLD